MEPGFHHLYAKRLAWRYRLLLAIPLALLGFLHPAFTLASFLPLLLPARLWERRALREIARISLAYPTALAYGEERLWQEAKRVSAEPPSFPWGLLLVYLVLLLLTLAPTRWPSSEKAIPFSLPTGTERPLRPQAPSERGSPAEKPSPSASPEEAAPSRPPQEKQPEASPAPREPESPQSSSGEAVSQKDPGASTPRAPQPKEGPGEEGLERGQGASPPKGNNALEEKGTPSPGPFGSAPRLEAPSPPPLPKPLGPGQEVLGPGQAGEGAGLPSPWRGGNPPEEVRRGVEVYLERTPLFPEARELLRRYFSGP